MAEDSGCTGIACAARIFAEEARIVAQATHALRIR